MSTLTCGILCALYICMKLFTAGICDFLNFSIRLEYYTVLSTAAQCAYIPCLD